MHGVRFSVQRLSMVRKQAARRRSRFPKAAPEPLCGELLHCEFEEPRAAPERAQQRHLNPPAFPYSNGSRPERCESSELSVAGTIARGWGGYKNLCFKAKLKEACS